MKLFKFVIALLCLACATQVFAVDKETAAAYAHGAAKAVSDGKTELARDICYKALAQDEDCPEALYELGKIFEKDGNTVSAADFLVRASRELGKQEGAHPEFASKRLDAETRIKRLNEYAAHFTSLLADYTMELNTITKKSPDALTVEEACDRADALNLREVLPPEKGPKFERAATAPPPKTEARNPGNGTTIINGRRVTTRMVDDEPPTVIPPDVERTLKAAGWTKITGTWTKKGDGIYEVTKGKLEAAKTNGYVQVIIHKGGTGNIKVMVRNNFYDYNSSSSSSSGVIRGFGASSWASGYGFMINGSSCKSYIPEGLGTSTFEPYLDHDTPLTEAFPKNKIMVMVNDTKLDYFINDKLARTCKYKIPSEGPFIIEVNGTWTIEAPQTKGQ